MRDLRKRFAETAEAVAWNMPNGPKAELIRAFPELLAVNAAPAKTTP